MPVLSYKSPNISEAGDIVEVSIFPPIYRIQELTENKAKIPFAKVVGLIDTGASRTAIDESIAADLNLIFRDVQDVLTPAGESEHFFV